MKRKYIATMEEEINNNIQKNSNLIQEHNTKLNYLLQLINKLNDNLNNFQKNVETKIENIYIKQDILNKKVNFIENNLEIEMNFVNTRSKSPPSYFC
jgi:vacuolar-type H+-ATPase subunit I/STV1